MSGLIVTKDNVGSIISTYNKVRDLKEQKAKEHKEELKPLNEGLANMENAMLAYINENKLQAVNTDTGASAYKKTRVSATVQDRESFLDFMLEHPDLMPMMEVRASATTINEHLEDDGDLPPGVKLTRHTQIVFKRG